MSIDNFVAVENQDDGSSWEIHTSDTLPEPELCTAIACVALTGAGLDRAVLSYGRRGWKVPAGAVEPGESLDTAVRRETLEKAGYAVADARLIGYRKITHTTRPTPGSRSERHPWPTSYIGYYVARTERPLAEPTSESDEFQKSRDFSDEEAQELVLSGKMKRREYLVMSLGLSAASLFDETEKHPA